MSSENIDIFLGGTFHFDVVGAGFTVHKSLISRNSKVLMKMMENGMQESQKGSAPLQDTDKSTFARFMEFIYTGDYNPAEPQHASTVEHASEDDASGDDMAIVEDEANELIVPAGGYHAVPPPPPPAVDDWGFATTEPLARKKKSIKKKTKPSFMDSFASSPALESPSFPARGESKTKLPSPTSDVVVTAPLKTCSEFLPSGDWTMNYLPMFLSHAQMYVFADTYEIPQLQQLAVRRLDEALEQLQYFDESTTNIAELVQYIYEHTPDRKEEVDVLRTVVTNFAANNIESLRSSESFNALLRNGGPFADYLVGKMSDRFAGS